MDSEKQLEPRTSAPGRSIFVGPHGLRPGWGCFFFLLLLFLYGEAVNTAARQLLHGQKRPALLPPGLMIPFELVEAAGVVFVTAIMARAERRPFTSFGLGGTASLPRFLGGLGAGFAAISALVGLLWAFGLAAWSGPTLPTGAALRYGLAWGLGFLLTGIFEELLLRGYLLFTLARGIGFWWAALLLSAAFGLIHGTNPGETPVGLFAAAAVGLLFCLSIRYTGSLWWAIGFHAAWDWGESFFWGTSDSGMLVRGHLLNEHALGPRIWSGGATGPEGSLLVFPILLVSALCMFLWWGMRKSPRHAEP